MSVLIRQCTALIPHVFAGGLALVYAWFLAGTPLRTTGVQFISPFIVMILVHFSLFGLEGRLRAGFVLPLLGQASRTAIVIMVVLGAGSFLAPAPAYAEGNEGLYMVLMVVVCAAMIAAVAAVVGGVIYLLVRLVRWALAGDDEGPTTRVFDVASLVLSLVVLTAASLEGVPRFYAFDAAGRASATYDIAASPARVWEVMQTATSPSFALPGLLTAFPQPVAVAVDEGTGVGANRVVVFAGREGAGAMHLRVIEQDGERAVFDVVSDSTPFAGWIGYDKLIYRVEPIGENTRLHVTWTYERKLAPAWFFDPVMQGATALAADVLARDVALRAVH